MKWTWKHYIKPTSTKSACKLTKIFFSIWCLPLRRGPSELAGSSDTSQFWHPKSVRSHQTVNMNHITWSLNDLRVQTLSHIYFYSFKNLFVCLQIQKQQGSTVGWSYNRRRSCYGLSVSSDIFPSKAWQRIRVQNSETDMDDTYSIRYNYLISFTELISQIFSDLSSDADTKRFESADQATSDIPCNYMGCKRHHSMINCWNKKIIKTFYAIASLWYI